MGKILPVCIVCKKVPEEGIGDGIFIRRKFLCLDCEKDIAALKYGAEKYAKVAGSLRLIWHRTGGS